VCKSWTVHGKSEMAIDSFERKKVKENDKWRIIYNNE
jgi:hypothetical protein